MQLLVEMFPVQDMRHPSKTGTSIEECQSELPRHHEGVDKEEVPRERDKAIVHYVGIFEVDLGVLHIVTGEEKQFSFSVELNGLGGLVHLVCTLQILVGTLGQLRLGGVHNFVQVVHLTEVTHGGLGHHESVVSARAKHRCQSTLIKL